MIDLYRENFYKELIEHLSEANKKGKLAILTNYQKKFRFNTRWAVVFDEMFLSLSKDKQITLYDMRILNYLMANLELENYIQVTQKEISENLDIDQADVSRSIRKLLEKGYIEKITKGGIKAYRFSVKYAWKGGAKEYEEAKSNVINIQRNEKNESSD